MEIQLESTWIADWLGEVNSLIGIVKDEQVLVDGIEFVIWLGDGVNEDEVDGVKVEGVDVGVVVVAVDKLLESKDEDNLRG